MKIRTGFVSNSSSSSFVVKTSLTPAEFVSRLIPLLVEDKKRWGNDYSKFLLDQKEEVDKMIANNDKSNFILVGTCNYDTEVSIGLDNSLYINTCNNEPWDSYFNDIDGIDSWKENGEDYEY